MAPNEIDPYPNKWTGRRVSFDRETGRPVAGVRLVGVVESQAYTGKTERGAIPDWQLVIRGESGKTLTVSLVENRCSFPE